MVINKCQHLLLIMVLLIPVLSAPLTENNNEAQIEESQYTNEGDGNYYFGFKTSNGIIREETGRLVNKGLPNEHISVEGSYLYTNPDGKQEIVNYKADENGFIKVEPSKFMNVTLIADGVLSSLLG